MLRAVSSLIIVQPVVNRWLFPLQHIAVYCEGYTPRLQALLGQLTQIAHVGIKDLPHQTISAPDPLFRHFWAKVREDTSPPMPLSLGGDKILVRRTTTSDDFKSNLKTASASTPVSPLLESGFFDQTIWTFWKRRGKHLVFQNEGFVCTFCGCKDAFYTK